ncbi:MAG: hypothetical protein P4L68_08290 [Methylovirgula sp.]|nr:hypothetical protein [Methylovirgula sp.]
MAACSLESGSTILIGIACGGASNDDLIGATCAAVLKAAVMTIDGFAVPPSTAPTVATFAAAARAAAADVGPGWDLSIDPATSAALPIGTYVSNAVLTLASGLVVKTAPLFITLVQATS